MTIYNPQRFKSTDENEVLQLIEQNPFATAIAVVGGQPIISHLPLVSKKIGNRIELHGHMALANPMCKSMDCAQVTVIFQGPNAYISPKWYSEDDVPTWNYVVAHISGQSQILKNEEEIIETLMELTRLVENKWPSGWKFSIPEDLSGDNLKNSIVGFKIEVNEFQFKKKLSQNRSANDQAGVMKGLETRSDEQSLLLLKEMQKLYLENRESK